MAKIHSWEVPDAFSEKVEPLLPPARRDSNKKGALSGGTYLQLVRMLP